MFKYLSRNEKAKSTKIAHVSNIMFMFTLLPKTSL